MQRRDFLKNCSLFYATGIGVAILTESCGSIYYASSKKDEGKIIVKKNEFIDTNKVIRKFVVIRPEKLQFPICIYKNENEYNALYMQCTHQGCELQPNKSFLVCPCHGSEFSNTGKVQSPPADSDLKQFKINTDNENIYIQL